MSVPVYEEDFSAGNGVITPPETPEYRSSTWSGGSDTPEVNRPELAWTEDVQIGFGEGPGGENVLKANSNLVNGAWVVKDIGDLTSPNGTTGWWNADQGYMRVDIKLDADFYSTAVDNPILMVIGPQSAKRLYVTLHETSTASKFNIKVVGDTDGATFTVYDTGAVNTPSIEVATHAHGWYTMVMRWQCGTVSGAYLDVLADGWVTVDFGPKDGTLVRMLTTIDKALAINMGLQNNQADAGTSFVGTAVQNWARGAALGFYGLNPSTNWMIFDETDPIIEDVEETTGGQIWQLDPGGGNPGSGSDPDFDPDDPTDASGAADDNGEVFFASLITRPFTPTTILNRMEVKSGALVTRAAENVEVVVELLQDLKPTAMKSVTADLTAVDDEEHKLQVLDNLSLRDVRALQVKFRDTDTPAGRWSLGQCALRVEANEKAK